MIRSIVAIGLISWTTCPAAWGQFDGTDLRSAVISMSRKNHCHFVQSDPTDIRQCPTYSVSIAGDGTVTYEGRGGVRTLGKRTHKTTLESVRVLLAEFERADFFSLRDRYEQVQVGDLMQTIDHAIATTVSISVAGRTKSVYDFYGTPEVVKRLEQRIDEASDSRRYTGRPPDNARQPTS